MNAEQVAALREAAGEGVECDGLRVAEVADGYVFEVPGDRRERLGREGLRAACEAHSRFVSNWHHWRDLPDHERAFLRWIESAEERDVETRYEALADGISETWGQLLVTAALGVDGRRVYEIRHEADEGVDTATLAVHTDPLDARSLVETDAKGRYRPLKTAPTLDDGWVFAGLDARDCARTVDFVYPATVANWHRERRGDLDVSHYRETAERQTGIYDIIDELPVEAVEWMAEACCVDSQCLRRREWDEDEETELDVPRGDGEFPCREPCSVVVAAARKWTRLEREETRSYEFELTPSEKEQVEAIVEAVADGRTDEIREADVSEGANRYRARYLRAKRFDEAGDLSGTPTE